MVGVNEKLKTVSSELLPAGGARAVLLTGADQDTDRAKKEVSKALIGSKYQYLWAEVDGKICDSPDAWFANFARSLRGGAKVNPQVLGVFARRTGKMLAVSQNQSLQKSDSETEPEALTLEDKFVHNFEELVSVIAESQEGSKIIPTLCFSNLSAFTSAMLTWMSRELNTALRKSKIFRHARFVFTDTKESKICTQFFSSFGFERVKILKILSEQPTKKQIPVVANQTKELKNPMNSPNLKNSMEADRQNEKDFNTFPEEHRNYLMLACLPHFINRDTLEYFCSPRDAAYCYNWLIRQKGLVTSANNKFLVLNPSVKKSAREFLKLNDPHAEKKEVLASVLDKFMEYFSDPEEHWVPVNLQLFGSFSKGLIFKVFDSDRAEIIDGFIDENPDVFSSENGNYVIKDELKLIIQRLIELTDLEPLEGLVEKISAQWKEDQVKFEDQKRSLENERSNMAQEIDEIKEQITHFSQMRDQLIEESKNPSNYKAKKNYTFSMSLPLLVLGLGTVGASLFSESIGSYHAACGLFLTFIGFFWPNVETQKPEFQTVGGKPKLAIETQQRSFNHRISGLVNRASSLKESVSTLDTNLESLKAGAQTPYLTN